MKNYFVILFFILMTTMGHQALATVQPTASISPSTTTINHPVSVALSIINPGSSAVTITNIKLTATSTSNPTSAKLPVAFSVYNSGPNAPIVSLSGSNAVTSNVSAGTVIFFSPSTGITGTGSGTYSIGGTVYTSDGAVSPITIGAVATINPVPLPAYERQ